MSEVLEVPTAGEMIFDMPADEYHSKLALSNSGMKDLAVSPLHYWHQNLNPNRVSVLSSECQFGTAVHCLVLEGNRAFNERYVRNLDMADFPGCLVTIEDLRGWLRDKGHQPKGTRKEHVIAQVLSADPCVKIWDVITQNHSNSAAGKVLLDCGIYDNVHRAADALLSEAKLRTILREGQPEISLFDSSPDTGVPLKARLDWLSGDCILDLKTFSSRRNKPISACVADAIYYESYFRQAYLYAILHQRITGRSRPIKFVFAFVESEPPYEVVLRELRPTPYGIAALNVYWSTAEIQVRHFCRLWKDYMLEFGPDREWRREQDIELLMDEELRGMAFA